MLPPTVEWSKEEFESKVQYVGKQFKIVTRNKLEIQAIKQALTDLEQLKKEDLVIEEEMSRIENDADASVL